MFNLWIRRSPGEGNGYPLQYFCWKAHGQRSLAGCYTEGCKGSDMTEQPTLSQTAQNIWSFFRMYSEKVFLTQVGIAPKSNHKQKQIFGFFFLSFLLQTTLFYSLLWSLQQYMNIANTNSQKIWKPKFHPDPKTRSVTPLVQSCEIFFQVNAHIHTHIISLSLF